MDDGKKKITHHHKRYKKVANYATSSQNLAEEGKYSLPISHVGRAQIHVHNMLRRDQNVLFLTHTEIKSNHFHSGHTICTNQNVMKQLVFV